MRETKLTKKKFSLKDGHEVRGMMIRLYPDKDQEAKLELLESDSRHVWNWLVKQTEDTLAARAAYAVKTGVVPPRPTRPSYDGLEPEDAKSLATSFRKSAGEWHGLVYKATNKMPGCEFRKFKDLLVQFGAKHDYQLLKRVLGWRVGEDEPEREIEPGAFLLQSLTKNYFQKSERRKKFRRATDSMPIQVRSGKCFDLGNFGTRRGKPFYDCQIAINGLKIKGRLPGKLPEGRVLEGVSVRKLADGWWASIKQELPIRPLPAPVPGTTIGIDVGLDFIAAMSDGTQVPNKRGKELAERIAGRQAMKRPVGRLHLQAARWAKHTIYNDIIKPLLLVETIKIERLDSKLGQRGSVKVSSMRQVASMLTQRYGEARVREVEPHFTSQDCSQCGHRSKETWGYAHGRIGECTQCGYRCDRDINAARNIAAKDACNVA